MCNANLSICYTRSRVGLLLHCGIYRHAKQFVTTVILGTDEHFFIYFFLAGRCVNGLGRGLWGLEGSSEAHSSRSHAFARFQ